jgi:hypothetical protein
VKQDKTPDGEQWKPEAYKWLVRMCSMLDEQHGAELLDAHPEDIDTPNRERLIKALDTVYQWALVAAWEKRTRDAHEGLRRAAHRGRHRVKCLTRPNASLDLRPVRLAQPPDVARPLTLHSRLPEQVVRIIAEVLRRSIETAPGSAAKCASMTTRARHTLPSCAHPTRHAFRQLH